MKIKALLLTIFLFGCDQSEPDLCINTPSETVCFSQADMEAAVESDLCINDGGDTSCWPTDPDLFRRLEVYYAASDDLVLQRQFITGLYEACLRNYDQDTCHFYYDLIP